MPLAVLVTRQAFLELNPLFFLGQQLSLSHASHLGNRSLVEPQRLIWNE